MTKAKKRSAFGTVWYREDRGAWFVKWRHRGRQILRKASSEKGKEGEKAARAKLREVQVLEEKGKPLGEILSSVFSETTSHKMTFRDLAALYLSGGMDDKKESTRRNDIHRLRIICKAAWAGKYLADISTSDINRWRHARKKKTSVATANRDVALSSAAFRFAVEMGWAERNPTRDLRGFSEAGRARDIFLTKEEVAAVLEAAADAIRPLLLCAIHAGLRAGELTQLRWRAVDLAEGTITVEADTSKTSKARRVPMTEMLKQELRELRGRQKVKRLDRSDHVFRTKMGCPWKGKYVSAEARKVFDCLKDVPAERRAQFCLHVCRHTFASHLVQRGVSLPEVAYLLGHSSTYVTSRYSHLSPDTGREAVALLSQALGG